MRRSFALSLAVAALACVLGAASAGAATWSAPRAVAPAGTSAAPAVAVDAGGGIAVGFAHTVGLDGRVEVRRGTTGTLLRGPATLVASAAGPVDRVAVAWAPDPGRLAVAWSRFDGEIARLFGATIDALGTVGPPQDLTVGSSRSAPGQAFVPGSDGSLRLFWTGDTTAAARAVAGPTYGPPIPLPTPGAVAQPRLAVDHDGTAVVVWIRGGRVFASQAPAGGTFGTPAILSATGRARAPQVVALPTGEVVAAWLQTRGRGNGVVSALRPRGGEFGVPRQIAPPTERAFAPRLVATPGAELVVTWVRTNVRRGFGTAPGIVRAQRVAPNLRLDGAPLRLSPRGVTALEPVAAQDGAGGVIAAWTASRSGRRSVQARRIAPDGAVQRLRTLSRGRVDSGVPPALAAAGGRAITAWRQRGDVRYSVYR